MKKAKDAVGQLVWEVTIEYEYLGGRLPKNLLVTTLLTNIATAVGAAERLLKQSKKYPKAVITGVVYKGQISA